MSEIDSRAVVSPRARLSGGVRVGAGAFVGDDVELGDDCVVMPQAVIQGPSRFGPRNVFHPLCSVGAEPQDLKYKGERTELVAGESNVYREFVTINRGTAFGGGTTRIGNHNLFMSFAHVGHDSQVGSHTIFVNGATLAGHVEVADHATVGAYSTVHQFCRVGRHAYIGALTAITKDVAPFALVVDARDVHCYGVNTVGLERQGFDADRLKTIERAFRLLLRSKLNTSQALEQMRAELDGSADVRELIEFIESAQRGLIK